MRAIAVCGLRFAVCKNRISLCWLVFCCLLRPALAADCLSDGRYVMGTVLEVTLCSTDTAQSQHTLNSLFISAARLDSLLTTFSPNSPLSRLNTQAGHGTEPVPPEVRDVLSLSLRYWQLTRGTFDITVGPLMALWRQANAEHVRPSFSAVQQARALVGSEKIKLLPHGAVALQRRGMSIDLGGIGKGYALDHLASSLQTRGIANVLLNFGQSSIWALGQPPDATGWHVLVRQPDGGTVGLITLRDQALSVSGSLGQSFVIKGQKYGHVIDPRTGEPLRRDMLACVLAPSAAQAEALSKALLILGEREGLALLQRLPHIEGFLIEANGQYWMTAGWKQATAFVSLL